MGNIGKNVSNHNIIIYFFLLDDVIDEGPPFDELKIL